MKILFVSHSSSYGGGERSLLTLVEHLRNNYEIKVLLPTEGPLVDKLHTLKIPCHICDYSWWTVKRDAPRNTVNKTFQKYMDESKVIAESLASWRPDCVYTNTSVICTGALLAKMLKIPHIWHIREFGEKDHGFVFEYGLRNTEILIDSLSTATIFNSYATKAEFKTIKTNPHIVYNAVEPFNIKDKKSNIPTYRYKNSLKILIAGTISERKGQLDAVKAVSCLINKRVDVELVLLGHCNYVNLKEEILTIRNSCRDPSRIQILEFTNNPYPVFSEADVVAVTSKNEAFGRTILEGWLLQKAVIGTSSGGIPEVIEDNLTGLLYPPGNIAALMHQIKRLKKDSTLRELLANKGNEATRNMFSVKNYVSSVDKIIQATLEKGFISSDIPLLKDISFY